MKLIRAKDKKGNYRTWEFEYIDKKRTCVAISIHEFVPRGRWNENTTTVYREAYHIMKLGNGIEPLSESSRRFRYEIRYYEHSPPVKGKGPTQEPKELSGAQTLEEAIGEVFDLIGYPRDNRKIKEYMED